MAFDVTPEGNMKCTGCGNVYEPAGAATHVCKPDDTAPGTPASRPAYDAERAAAKRADAEAGAPAAVDGEEAGPLTVTIACTTRDGAPAPQVFRLVESLSLGAQFDLAEAWEANTMTMTQARRLLSNVIAPDDEKAFDDLLYSKTLVTSLDAMRDAIIDAVRAIGGRPFPGSTSSLSGPPTTGPSSTDDAPATT